MPITSAAELEKVDAIRTDTFLDTLSGIGGLPVGRITEVYGDAGLGKSTVCLQAIASAQARGLKCLVADAEWAYDARYASSLGVDNSQLDLLREQHAEDLLEALESAVDSGKYQLVILDAVGAILPRQEAEKAVGEKSIGGQAGLVARFCRKIVPILSLRNCALVVINHSFTDIMTGSQKTSGGKKLEYHKSFSVSLRKKQGVSLKQGDRVVGKVIVAKVVKNKIGATEGMEVDGQILFGSGFSSALSVLDTALERGIITQEGRTYFFKGERICSGMPKLRDWAKENEETLKEALNA